MRRRLLVLLAAAGLIVLLSACTRGAVKPDTISYALEGLNDSGMTGTVTFEKITDTHTAVIIDVSGGLTAGQSYPAHIHVGSHPGGNIYITLEPVDGDTGSSAKMVSATDAGQAVDYEYLINYDGYVNVHNPAQTALMATGETGEGANDVQINRR